MNTRNLRFMPTSPNISTEFSLYRTANFPPPYDWVMSVDEDGGDLSRFGDDFWDYRAFERSATFNFKRIQVSDSNVQFIKQAMFLVLYHPRLFPGQIRSCSYCFQCLVKIAKACDEHKILITDLPRHPLVHQYVAESLQGSRYKIFINFLHKLRLYGEVLNFEIADKRTLAYFVSQQRNWEPIQTPYIPPRIWSYQINRLNECLDDFLKHQAAIEAAFSWISKAYKHNLAAIPDFDNFQSPFFQRQLYKGRRILFNGGFNKFLAEYQLLELFEKWMGSEGTRSVAQFASYLNMVRDASLLYVMNFSLQRLSEVQSLRSDCFLIECDARLGEIALIVGETTKTDSDDDARWVVPKTVKKAVGVAATIAELRMRHCKEDASQSGAVKTSIPLSLAATEPWAFSSKNQYRNAKGEAVTHLRFGPFIDSHPHVLNPQSITVSESDWKIAVSMTPNLGRKNGFGISMPWPFAAHQLRRTTNVNMFSSTMVSDNSLQWAMKHLSRHMTLYYGRNHTNLRLNSDAETAVIIESYSVIYRQLVDIVTDSMEYIRPHLRELIPSDIINLVHAREERQLMSLIKQGSVGCRRTLLGYCMKAGSCEYGGIESVSQCATGNGGGVCADAIFERKNVAKLKRLQTTHEKQMELLAPSTPRYKALKQEIFAIDVYINAINR